MIRLATPDDAAGILDIYAPYVQHTSITFETEVPSVSEMADRIQQYLSKYPWLVYEVEGKIAGYAYASTYRERVAYQWSVECSVYIHEDFFRQGLAARLYTKLFQFLKFQQLTTVYAVINLPNDQSVKLHEKLGFTYFATYEKVGFKLGKWKNVGWWQLQLNDFENPPKIPHLFSQLSEKEIDFLLNEN